MESAWTLSASTRLALAIIELGPVSVTEALDVWKYRCPTIDEMDGREAFINAISTLMSRGLIRIEEDGRLAITIAGRAAMAGF